MYDYVIVHASFGHPFEHWTPWLFDELTKNGKKVLAPQFPCGYDEQNYQNWEKILDAYRGFFDENTIFVGHSIGPSFICDYLANRKLKAKKLVFVAPVFGKIDVPDYDHVNSSFFAQEKFREVKHLCKEIICYISRTDPYVPNSNSEWFANEIGAKVKYFENAGHFNTAAGFTTFAHLLDEIIK